MLFQILVSGEKRQTSRQTDSQRRSGKQQGKKSSMRKQTLEIHCALDRKKEPSKYNPHREAEKKEKLPKYSWV